MTTEVSNEQQQQQPPAINQSSGTVARYYDLKGNLLDDYEPRAVVERKSLKRIKDGQAPLQIKHVRYTHPCKSSWIARQGEHFVLFIHTAEGNTLALFKNTDLSRVTNFDCWFGQLLKAIEIVDIPMFDDAQTTLRMLQKDNMVDYTEQYPPNANQQPTGAAYEAAFAGATLVKSIRQQAR